MRYLDAFFFLRPLLLAPAATMFLIGRDAGRAAVASGLQVIARSASGATLVTVVGAAVALCVALVATHIINQLADRESDRVNAKLPILAAGLVTPRGAAALLAGLALAFFAALAAVPPQLRLIEVVALLLGIAYSAPPLSLKTRAGWDLAANALGYGGIAFAIGWGTAAPLAWGRLASSALPWVLAVGGVFAATTVADEAGDRAAGQGTLGVRLGPRRARVAALFFMAGAAAAAAVVSARAPLFLSLATLPVLALPILRPSRAADHVAFQVSAAIPTLYAAARRPLFAAVLLILVVATRTYFGLRFGIRYPAFGESRRADGTPRV